MITAHLQAFRVRIQRNEPVAILGLIGGLTVILVLSHWLTASGPVEAQEPPSTMPSMDTYIPEGLTLVPITLANGESLASLIEDFAIVDLYETGPGGLKPGRKVGHRLRLVRSPMNPQAFAVLVPDGQTAQLFQTPDPLFGVLLSRSLAGPGKVQTQQKIQSRIQYVH